MSNIEDAPPLASIPIFDRNTIKWSGYFGSTEQAQEHLVNKAKAFANTENKLVLTAKKEFVNRHFRGYFLYRFLVVLANK